MHLVHASFFLLATLNGQCIASPFISGSEGRSILFKDASGPNDPDAKRNLVRRASATSIPVGYSTDGRCGPKNGGLLCNPNSTVYVGTCCSGEGWCGSTAEYCADGCVSGCFNRATGNQHDVKAAGRCGPSFAGRTCDADGPYGGCCSTEGWCGSSSLYCDISEGCMSGCNTSASSTLATMVTQLNPSKTTSTSSTLSRLSASSSKRGTASTHSSTWYSSCSTWSVSHESTTSRLRMSSSSTSKSTQFTLDAASSLVPTSGASMTKLSTSQSTQIMQSTRTSTGTPSSSRKASIASSISSSLRSPSFFPSSIVKSTASLTPLYFSKSSSTDSTSFPSSKLSSSSSSLSSSTSLRPSISTMIPTGSASLTLNNSDADPSSPATPSTYSTFSNTRSVLPSLALTTLSTLTTAAGVSSTSVHFSTSATNATSSTSPPPAVITISGIAYTAITPSTTSSTKLVASVITISGISYEIYQSSLTTASSGAPVALNSTSTISSFNSNLITSASSIIPSTSSAPLLSSPSSDIVTSGLTVSTMTPASSATRPRFSPSNAAQSACANPFETFPNGTNGLGLTVECFVTLDVIGYLKNWISTHYPKVCTGSLDFSTCFEEYLGIYDAGSDCTGIKTGSCTGFKYSEFAHMNWDVRDIYILQSIYGINQFFASWYNGLLGAESGAALTIGAIVNRINPPKTTNVLLNDILAALSFGLSAFTLPDEIVKAVQGLEMLEDAVRATPGFVRAFTPEKTSNDQIQISDIQAQLGGLVNQFLTQISNATAAIETNATAFTTWASTGLFINNLVFLDQMVQDNYKYLNTFVVGQALNANNIVATVGLDTNVAQLQANSSDSLSYNINCPGYDNNTMCNGWWYDAALDASFALDNLNSMSKNMHDDLSYFFNSGWTNGTLLFEGALKCKQSGGGGDPVLNLSPGTSLSSMAQCFSTVKLCTWNLGCDLDSQCEFSDCPLQSGFGVNGCGDSDYAVYDFNVPYNYLGTFLTGANPVSEVCNNGP